MITGTPIRNGLHELGHLLVICAPTLYGAMLWSDFENMSDQEYQFVHRNFMISRTMDDYPAMKALMPKLFDVLVFLDPPTYVKAFYDEVMHEHFAEYDDNDSG